MHSDSKKIYLESRESALALLKGVAAVLCIAAGLLIFAAMQHSDENKVIGAFEIQLVSGAGEK